MDINDVTENINIDTEHAVNVFGQFDVHMKKIEKELDVDIYARGEDIVVRGKDSAVKNAKAVIDVLQELSKRGNEILEQNVDYAVEMAKESENTQDILDMDKELICHTISGKPVKPKTLGQKKYVDAIRNKMIVTIITILVFLLLFAKQISKMILL